MKYDWPFRVGDVGVEIGAEFGQLLAKLFHFFALFRRQGQTGATVIAHRFIQQFLVLAGKLRICLSEGLDRLVNVLAIIDSDKPVVHCFDGLLRRRAHFRIGIRFLNDGGLVSNVVGFVSEIVQRNDRILKRHLFPIELANCIERGIALFDCLLGGGLNRFGRLRPIGNGQPCVCLSSRIAIAID